MNEVYLEHSRRGVPGETIYRMYIRDQFLISNRTFYNYLGIPYQKQLDKL